MYDDDDDDDDDSCFEVEEIHIDRLVRAIPPLTQSGVKASGVWWWHLTPLKRPPRERGTTRQ